MGKNPAFQFYPADWTRDLEHHPLYIEGAWIRICCKLWWSETRGKQTLTYRQWSRVLRINTASMMHIISYIKREKIGDVEICNDFVTVSNRRMVRDEESRENLRLRVAKHRGKSSRNGDETVMKRTCTEVEDEDEEKHHQKFDAFWSSYPRKVGKRPALQKWGKLDLSNGNFEKIIGALERQKKSPQWLKDNGQYIPHPTTWLNQERWNDEIEPEKETYRSNLL